MSAPAVGYLLLDGAAWGTLDRPDTGNPLDAQMGAELLEAIRARPGR